MFGGITDIEDGEVRGLRFRDENSILEVRRYSHDGGFRFDYFTGVRIRPHVLEMDGFFSFEVRQNGSGMKLNSWGAPAYIVKDAFIIYSSVLRWIKPPQGIDMQGFRDAERFLASGVIARAKPMKLSRA